MAETESAVLTYQVGVLDSALDMGRPHRVRLVAPSVSQTFDRPDRVVNLALDERQLPGNLLGIKIRDAVLGLLLEHDGRRCVELELARGFGDESSDSLAVLL